MANAVKKITREHQDYGRVLACLSAAVKKLRGAEWRRQAGQGPEAAPGYGPSLDLLFSIVYYVRVFPDKFHHPKEEEYLFKALRRRRPDSAALLERVTAQHSAGARLIDGLDAALKAYQANYPDGLDALEAAADAFVAAQRDHMRLEEKEVMPLARAALTDADWRAIDRAFDSNADPLFGENLETGFHALHDHILRGLDAA